jgi:RNA recognition motif-containing protein
MDTSTPKEAKMNLYVGNISPAVHPAELQQIFAGMGQVLYAKLADAEQAAGDRGYAFVYVPNDENARNAVAQLNGKLLKGEKLTVSPMSERPGVVGGTVK